MSNRVAKVYCVPLGTLNELYGLGLGLLPDEEEEWDDAMSIKFEEEGLEKS